MKNIIIWSAFCLVSIFSTAQGTSYGFTYGQGVNENTNRSLTLEYNLFFEINEKLYIGPYFAAGWTNFNLGSSKVNETILIGELAASARYYINETFKTHLNLGYSYPITNNEFNYDDGIHIQSVGLSIQSGVFAKLYLELDLDSFAIIAGPSFSFASPYNFTTFNLGFRFNNYLI